MVKLSLFNDVPTFSEIFNDFFYSFPKATKPPIEVFPILDDGKDNPDPEKSRYGEFVNIKGYEIQMALAGFKSEEVKVSAEDNLLIIEGDNTNNEIISSRFRCKFCNKIPFTKQADVKNAKVSFENGLLRVEVMSIEPKNSKTILFGV